MTPGILVVMICLRAVDEGRKGNCQSRMHEKFPHKTHGIVRGMM